jgi:hypothetical protein
MAQQLQTLFIFNYGQVFLDLSGYWLHSFYHWEYQLNGIGFGSTLLLLLL